MKKLIILFIFCSLSRFSIGQEVLSLPTGTKGQSIGLDAIHWLQGYWVGEGLGGACEELWLPAADNIQPGVFRYMQGGKVILTEYMTLEEKDETLTIKLKHFGRDLKAWEDKDEWMSFPLVKVEGQTAYFDGLTYHREGNKLFIALRMEDDGKTKIEKFELSLTTL